MPEKTIITGQVALGRHSSADAHDLAAKVVGDRVHVVEVRNMRGLYDIAELPVSYLIYAEGQECPCCGNTTKGDQ